MEGTIKSWINNYSFGYGAYWSFEYTTRSSGTGITTVDWNLYTRGRTTSPTWISTGCILTLNYNNKTEVLYNEDYTSGEDCSFNNVLRKSGSFQVKHNSNGTGSFTVDFDVRIYETYNRHKTSETVDILPLNYPYTACGAPKVVKLSATTVSKSGRALLSWSGATSGTGLSISGYNIYEKNGSAPTISSYDKKTYHTGTSLYVYPNQTNGGNRYFAVETVSSVSGYNSSISSQKPILVTNTPPTLSATTGTYEDGNYKVTLNISEQDSQTQALYYTINGGAAQKISLDTNSYIFSYPVNQNTNFAFWVNDGLDNSNTITKSCIVPVTFNKPIPISNGYQGYTSSTTAEVASNFCLKPKFTQPSGIGGTGSFSYAWEIQYNSQTVDITNDIVGAEQQVQYDASILPIGTSYNIYCTLIEKNGTANQRELVGSFVRPAAPSLAIQNVQVTKGEKIGQNIGVTFSNLVRENQIIKQQIYFKINAALESRVAISRNVESSGELNYDASSIASGASCTLSYYLVDEEGNKSETYEIPIGIKAAPLLLIPNGNYSCIYSKQALKPLSDGSNYVITTTFPTPSYDNDATLSFFLVYQYQEAQYETQLTTVDEKPWSTTLNASVNSGNFISSISNISDENGTRIDSNPQIFLRIQDNYGNTQLRQLTVPFSIDWREFPVFAEDFGSSQNFKIGFIYDGQDAIIEGDTNRKIYQMDCIVFEYNKEKVTDRNNNSFTFRHAVSFNGIEYNLISTDIENHFYLPEILSQSEGEMQFIIYAEDGTILPGEKYNSFVTQNYIKVKQYIPQINIIDSQVIQNQLNISYSYTNIDSTTEELRGLQRFQNSTGIIEVDLFYTSGNNEDSFQTYTFDFPKNENGKFILQATNQQLTINLSKVPEQNFFIQIKFKFYYSYPGSQIEGAPAFINLSNENYIYLSLPTVAYRKNCVGVNTKVIEAGAVLDIYPHEENKLVIIHRIEDRGEIIINLEDGTITGLTIDCGKW